MPPTGTNRPFNSTGAAIAQASILATSCCHKIEDSQSAYPTKNIRFVVPVTTGGPSDIVARLLGERLSDSLGKQVIVDNRPGASNTIGAAMVAKAEPDGYTLLQAAANMATNPILLTDLPFDTIKDFAPVSLTHLTPYVFVVSSQSSVKSLQELIKYIKDDAGKITYGTTGDGSPQQLATLLFAQTAGGLGKMTEVPYKGSFPDIPTATEGGVPGYDFSSWGGVFAPAGTPRAIVQKLNAEIGAALANPDLRKRFTDMGLVAKHSTPEELGKFLQSEMTRWRAVLAKKQ